jgi:beta-glucosidase
MPRPLPALRFARLTIVTMALFTAPFAAFAASPSWLTAHDAEIKLLVERMTLAEKAGQMTQPDSGAIKDLSDIQSLALGSVLSGGSTDPASGNTLADWTAHVARCRDLALRTRLAIPLLYGIDAVHGHNNVLGAVVFPHNIGLGCTRDPALVRRVAEVTAAEVRATGIQWSFAPCVTVPRDLRWGRTYEGFSENPAVVAALGEAAVRGLQGDALDGPAAVLACAKHFIGDGGTSYAVVKGKARLDQGDTQVDEATLRAVHLAGYPAAIDAGVGTIMPSYSSWNGVKCSGNRALLTDLLKKELGFEGFLISDYNAIDQLLPAVAAPSGADATVANNNAFGQVRTERYKQCIELSINAGMDMVMVTSRYKDFIRQLQELVNEGKIPLSRIDDAVTRILRVKFALGLVPAPAATATGADAVATVPPPAAALQSAFGSAAHRAVAREAVQKSVVLLKNNARLLPLSRTAKRIHITGPGADDIGRQCGGWTIDWQGRPGAVTPGGTTLLTALRQSSGPITSITTSADAADARGADAVIVVVGEEPYAEGNGDRASLELSAADTAAVAAAHDTGVPVLVVVLSGRPLVLGAVAEQADAILAAWLPGTEGEGVADVLFGDVAPTGKLSFTWPRSTDQLPLGHASAGIANPLYSFGYGLSYDATPAHATDAPSFIPLESAGPTSVGTPKRHQ